MANAFARLTWFAPQASLAATSVIIIISKTTGTTTTKTMAG